MSFLSPTKQHQSIGSKTHGSRRLHLASSVILILGILLIGLALKGPMMQAQAAPIVDRPSIPVIYVSQSATGLNNGTSWANAFTSLEAALDAAQPNDEIWVAAGTYIPTERLVPTDPRSATFELRSGVALYGGFSGVETSLLERDWKAHPVILSGDISETNVITDNVYHVVYSSNVVSTTLLDGFTVTGGYADGVDEPRQRGGGLRNNSGSPRVTNVTFVDNLAQYGGGAYNDTGGNLTLVNVVFNHNTAQISGGGAFDEHGTMSLLNTVFNGNAAVAGGGGLYHRYDVVTLKNCVFNGNTSGTTGGGLWNEAGQPTMLNCTFSNNIAASEGGAIYIWGVGTTFTIHNSILWGNTAPLNPQINNAVGNVSYSLVQGGWSGIGNLNSNPQFVDAAAGNFRLSSSSPAINAGDSSVPALPAIDLDGNPRIIGAAVDMGAYEAPISLSGVFSFTPDPAVAGYPITGSVRITNTGVLTLHAVLTGTLSPHIAANVPLTWTTVITPGATWIQTLTGVVESSYRGPLTGIIEAATLEGPTGVFTATATALIPIYLPFIAQELSPIR